MVYAAIAEECTIDEFALTRARCTDDNVTWLVSRYSAGNLFGTTQYGQR